MHRQSIQQEMVVGVAPHLTAVTTLDIRVPSWDSELLQRNTKDPGRGPQPTINHQRPWSAYVSMYRRYSQDHANETRVWTENQVIQLRLSKQEANQNRKLKSSRQGRKISARHIKLHSN